MPGFRIISYKLSQRLETYHRNHQQRDPYHLIFQTFGKQWKTDNINHISLHKPPMPVHVPCQQQRIRHHLIPFHFMNNQQERRYQDDNQPKGKYHLLQPPPDMKDISCRAVRSHQPISRDKQEHTNANLAQHANRQQQIPIAYWLKQSKITPMPQMMHYHQYQSNCLQLARYILIKRPFTFRHYISHS